MRSTTLALQKKLRKTVGFEKLKETQESSESQLEILKKFETQTVQSDKQETQIRSSKWTPNATRIIWYSKYKLCTKLNNQQLWPTMKGLKSKLNSRQLNVNDLCKSIAWKRRTFQCCDFLPVSGRNTRLNCTESFGLSKRPRKAQNDQKWKDLARFMHVICDRWLDEFRHSREPLFTLPVCSGSLSRIPAVFPERQQDTHKTSVGQNTQNFSIF